MEDKEKIQRLEKEYQCCLRCGRKLKNEKAKLIGYGSKCLKKAQAESTKKRLF